MIQVHIPQDRVLISIDTAKGRSLFPDYRDMEVDNQLKVFRILSTLEDVDIVLPGHGPVTDQDNFMAQHRYISTLREEVLGHMRDGRPLSEIRELVTMDEFRDYLNFDNYIDANIVTMYDYLYRYREPNNRITDREAVDCIVDANCRTSDPH